MTPQQYPPVGVPQSADTFLSDLQATFHKSRVESPAPLRSGGAGDSAPILVPETLKVGQRDSLLRDTPPDGPCWRVRETLYGDRLAELTAVYLPEPLRKRNPGKPRRQGNRELMSIADVEKSAGRSRRKLRAAVVMMRADRMMTLTMQECVTDINVAWAYWRQFRATLSTFPWGQSFVVVPEYQSRGALHFHVALRCGDAWLPYSRLIAAWRKCIGGLGTVMFSPPPSCRDNETGPRIYGYLAKYLNKTFAGGEMNRKRYAVSKDIPPPVERIFYLPLGDDTPLYLSSLLADASGGIPKTRFIRPGVIHLRTF